jgi:hypothetical protein
MDEKSLAMLEFPHIREILAEYTSFSASRDLALSLKPLQSRPYIAIASANGGGTPAFSSGQRLFRREYA